MDRFFDIATRISTPLALSGFLAAAFFFIARQIIAKNIFPILTKHMSTALIRLIIDRLFMLALVAMVLGFFGFVLALVFKNKSVDLHTLRISQFLVGKQLKGQFIEVTINNPTTHDEVLSKFIYARGVSSAEMDAIPGCDPLAMEVWYAVRHGPITIATPGTDVAQAISFVRTGEADRSFHGRLHYAPGCHRPLFAQLEMNISVVAAAGRITKIAVFWPEVVDPKGATGRGVDVYTTKDLLANKDEICVFMGVDSDPLAVKACRPESAFDEHFL